jgi:hypothetical protein
MTLKKSCPLLVAALLLCVPVAAQAGFKADVIDGGACIPYPGYISPASGYSGINYQHWLYGFSDVAFCHLTMHLDWPLNALQYVEFIGETQPSQVVTARLCVHGFDMTVTCGNPVNLSGGGFQANFVFPPSLPPNADGAFVQFSFPQNIVSVITQVTPVWFKN